MVAGIADVRHVAKPVSCDLNLFFTMRERDGIEYDKRLVRNTGLEAVIVTFEYKCVAGPTIVAVKSARGRDQAVKAFEDIMNIEAAQGWEYVGIDEFHVSEPQGLFTRKRVYVPSKILVFRRVKAGIAATVPAKAAEPAVQPQPPEMPVALPPPSAPLAELDNAAADGPAEAPRSMKAIADKLKIAKV
jgi:hypothetical protein